MTMEGIRTVQQRLKQLGYAVAVSGNMDEATEAAIMAFQEVQFLPATGIPDDATMAALFPPPEG